MIFIKKCVKNCLLKISLHFKRQCSLVWLLNKNIKGPNPFKLQSVKERPQMEQIIQNLNVKVELVFDRKHSYFVHDDLLFHYVPVYVACVCSM